MRREESLYPAERYQFIADAGLTESEVHTSLRQVEVLIEKLRAEVTG